MKLAQQEIKATVTVNTSDLGSKKKDEEPPDKDAPARKKGEGPGVSLSQRISSHILKLGSSEVLIHSRGVGRGGADEVPVLEVCCALSQCCPFCQETSFHIQKDKKRAILSCRTSYNTTSKC